jgi:hypothetical protein
VRESGVARFDVIQQLDDLTRFVLVEVCHSSDDPAEHKKTAHYQTWRDTVAEMMAEPRSARGHNHREKLWRGTKGDRRLPGRTYQLGAGCGPSGSLFL